MEAQMGHLWPLPLQTVCHPSQKWNFVLLGEELPGASSLAPGLQSILLNFAQLLLGPFLSAQRQWSRAITKVFLPLSDENTEAQRGGEREREAEKQ